MTKKDYYKILGISRNATKEDIKAAYKRLAKQYHPDLHKGDKEKEEKFKEINEAARVLIDDKTRATYDKYGTADLSGMGAAGPGGFDFSDFDIDINDIFSNFFGVDDIPGGKRRRSRRGRDLQYNMEIELEDAASGAEKTIVIEKYSLCSTCNGNKARSASDIKTCPDCRGSGVFKQTQRTPFGMFSASFPCKKCQGTGEFIKEYCEMCDGEGRTRGTKKITVKIPPGIATGNILRIHGEGEAGDDGSTGDLFVVIKVKLHKTYNRKGDDLYIDEEISFVQAALGTKIPVPTLDGEKELHIPAGTQSNTLLKMKGMGMPRLNSVGAGDQYVRIIVKIPEKLTKQQEELLKEFAEASGERTGEKISKTPATPAEKTGKKGFFDKIRGR